MQMFLSTQSKNNFGVPGNIDGWDMRKFNVYISAPRGKTKTHIKIIKIPQATWN